MNIVKGYITFNLSKDVDMWGSQKSIYKDKMYTLKQQQKQCDKAFKELKKQESKGLIMNLTYSDMNGKVIMTWERVS